MSSNPGDEITLILQAADQGNSGASDALLPLVYDELRRLATARMAQEAAGQTLQPTALVHEAWLRLAGGDGPKFANRAHFFAVCAQLMRRILTDFARAHGYQKRGAGAPHIPLNEALVVCAAPTIDLVALEQALTRLGQTDLRKSKVVELRFFGGLTVEQTAEVLHISPETVARDWSMARAWLLRELDGGVHPGGNGSASYGA